MQARLARVSAAGYRARAAGGARSGLPALLLTLLVPSCGAPVEAPSARPPAQLVDAGPAPPLAEVATTIAAKFCRRATHASEAFVRDCTARLSVAVARWADPSVAWVSAASLARCQHERDPVRALRCARLRPGRALGAPCGDDVECESLWCSSEGTGCGVCGERGGLGASCDMTGRRTCTEPLRCTPNAPGSREGRCQLAQNPSCVDTSGCPGGLVCDGGRCVEARGYGEPCGPGAPCWPVSGVACVKGPDGARCERPTLPRVGQACDSLCEYPDVCDHATHTCVRGAKKGEPCDATRCGEFMTFCKRSRDGGPPTCAPIPHSRTDCE